MRTLILLFSKDGNRFYCEQGCVSSREDIQEVCKALLGECVNMSIPKPKISVEDVPEGITGDETVTIKGKDGKEYVFTFAEVEVKSDYYFVVVDGNYYDGAEEDCDIEPQYQVFPFVDTAFSSDGTCWCTQVVTIKAN